MKLKEGQRVYIKELKQFGNVITTEQVVNEYEGKQLIATHRIPVQKVQVQTPDGPKYVDWIKENYTLITGILQVMRFILGLITGK